MDPVTHERIKFILEAGTVCLWMILLVAFALDISDGYSEDEDGPQED